LDWFWGAGPMPFAVRSVMDSRSVFIVDWLRGEASMTALCVRHGISRKTGYATIARYQAGGFAGLAPRSRARVRPPERIAAAQASALLGLRDRHPTWGPRKLLARLRREDPAASWPAASTAGDLLVRESRVRPRRRRGDCGAGGAIELVEPVSPNASWSADFKGWFRTGDGVRCEPFTVTDGFSRYLLICDPVPQVSCEAVRPLMEGVFREYGLPVALRMDNGPPFGRRDGLAGLTQFSVWLLTLGVFPDFIKPGRPDMNARHERMHLVLQQDTASPPAATLAAQRERLAAWRRTYNDERPHEALEQRCPAAVYRRSERAYPGSVTAWEYPADHQVLAVIGDGYINWRGERLYLSGALRGHRVALAQRDDGDWAVRFRGFDLAVVGEASRALAAHRLRRTPADPPSGR